MQFSSLTEQALRKAGWYPGRAVDDKVEIWDAALSREGFTMFPSARKALLQFGQLDVRVSGPGLECAREPFEIDPLKGVGEKGYFDELAAALGAQLYPLGEACGGHCLLAIDENGRVFADLNEMRLIGTSIEEALEALIVGKVPTVIA